MALADEVQSRISTHVLAALTNKDDQQATTVNTTVLGLACSDAQDEFETETGVEFDVTISRHVSVCKDLVMLILQHQVGQLKSSDFVDMKKEWREKALRYARTDARDRPLMATSSELTMPQENPSGIEKKPDLHRSVWDAMMPDQP